MSIGSYPPQFGPHYWHVIHLSAYRLDLMLEHDSGKAEPKYAERRKVLRQFLQDLDSFLPCDTCTSNFLLFLMERPLPPDDPSGGKVFFRWSIDLHNHANGITGKRQVSHEEAEKNFMSYWTDYDRKKALSDQQLARMQDNMVLQNLKSENDQLRRWGTHPAGLTIAIVAIITTVIVLVMLGLIRLLVRH